MSFAEIGSRMVGAKAGRRGNSDVLNGGRVSVWEDEKVLEMVVAVVAQQCG